METLEHKGLKESEPEVQEVITETDFPSKSLSWAVNYDVT